MALYTKLLFDFISCLVEFEFLICLLDVLDLSSGNWQTGAVNESCVSVGDFLYVLEIHCDALVWRTEKVIFKKQSLNFRLTDPEPVGRLIFYMNGYNVIVVFGVENTAQYNIVAVRQMYGTQHLKIVKIDFLEHF